MADLTKRPRLVIGAVALILLAAGLSGCESDTPPEPKAVCGTGTSHGCFDLSSYGHLYCTVLQAREAVDADRIRPDELPEWADTSRRAGSITVFDFRRPPESGLTGAQYTQQLLNALHAKKLLQDTESLQARSDCLDDLTQRTVARTEGGWPPA